MKESEASLSSRERQIMDVIYRLKSATAREIQEELADELANATIRTVLRILENKGHLKHREVGRQFVYSPVRSRRSEASSALNRVLKVFYEGSVSNAVAGLIGSNRSKLSEEELDELAEIVAQARMKKKRGKK